MVSPYSCYPCDTFTWNNGINNWELASPCISNTITLSLTSVGSYNWNGQVITNSGSYTWVGTNSLGKLQLCVVYNGYGMEHLGQE